jgi:uncharacterized protein YndB with AHSA1/START domain
LDAVDIQRTRTLAATPQRVWDVLADFGAISSWVDKIDHSCILAHGDGPRGTARRVQIGRNVLVERITSFDAPRELGYDIEGLPAFFGRLHNRWTLRRAGDAGTVVTLTSTVETGSNPMQKLTERVVCRVMARESDAMLAGLADRLEKSGV